MFLEGADSNLKGRLYAYSSRRRGSAELHEGSPSAARVQQEVGHGADACAHRPAL
jgi:hypothetical protein